MAAGGGSGLFEEVLGGINLQRNLSVWWRHCACRHRWRGAAAQNARAHRASTHRRRAPGSATQTRLLAHLAWRQTRRALRCRAWLRSNWLPLTNAHFKAATSHLLDSVGEQGNTSGGKSGMRDILNLAGGTSACHSWRACGRAENGATFSMDGAGCSDSWRRRVWRRRQGEMKTADDGGRRRMRPTTRYLKEPAGERRDAWQHLRACAAWAVATYRAGICWQRSLCMVATFGGLGAGRLLWTRAA